ncbi:hypothetical protein [Thiothrix nivea]|uniref:Uncharacterized protein n=1 Tax=Thiothrix nivea (strain ATCC 35100 / DSM 5205 / JP2) TaxID=870187 RepID=A0A656HDN1_THINJ|nr:hypothetical protein [Thiothrix nivea]EIJ33550.1 hypothetical protein Thini_0925 [Thiothrix nivea DSM 5205]
MSQWEKLLVEAGLEDHKADWRKWRFIENIQLREVLLLTFGLNPASGLFYCEAPCFHDWWPCIRDKLATKSSQLAEKFGFIAYLASRKFVEPERCDESHPHYSPEACKDGYIYYDAEITAGQFAAWVSPILGEVGWELPPEFPIGKAEKSDASEKLTSQQARKHNNMLALIRAMAIDKYNYKPGERNTATGGNKGSIAVACDQQGFKIDGETVKKYLEEANEKHSPP